MTGSQIAAVVGASMCWLLPIYALGRQAVADAVVFHLEPKIAHRRAQAVYNARLAADADRQHAAFVRGDLATATYGRFQP